MSKNEGFSPEQLKLVDELVDSRVCCSRGEARRFVLHASVEKVRDRINKVKVVRKEVV